MTAGSRRPRLEPSRWPRSSVDAVCRQGEEPAGGLDLTTREAALRGGDSGPAIVPGKPDESPIHRKVAAGKMLPKGAPGGVGIPRWGAGSPTGAAWPGEVLPEPGTVAPTWALKRLKRPNDPAT